MKHTTHPDLLDACKCVLADAIAALKNEWDRSDEGFAAQIMMLKEVIARAEEEKRKRRKA